MKGCFKAAQTFSFGHSGPHTVIYESPTTVMTIVDAYSIQVRTQFHMPIITCTPVHRDREHDMILPGGIPSV